MKNLFFVIVIAMFAAPIFAQTTPTVEELAATVKDLSAQVKKLDKKVTGVNKKVVVVKNDVATVKTVVNNNKSAAETADKGLGDKITLVENFSKTTRAAVDTNAKSNNANFKALRNGKMNKSAGVLFWIVLIIAMILSIVAILHAFGVINAQEAYDNLKTKWRKGRQNMQSALSSE